MFEKFTESAIKVIIVAQEEARKLNHNFVAPEQILLGLLSGNLTSAQILNSQGLNIENVRIEVEKIIGKGSGSDVEIPFTPSTIELIQNASIEAEKFKQPITDLHLLLALTSIKGIPLQIFQNFNIDISKIKAITEEKIKKTTINIWSIRFICFCYTTCLIMLLLFSYFLLNHLITMHTLPRNSIITAVFGLIITFFGVRNNFIYRFGTWCIPIKLLQLIRIICLTASILFITILVLAFTIWVMVTVGKYKYFG